MKGCTTSTPLVHQRFHRGSAEWVAIGRLERSFGGAGDGSLWQPDDERTARTRALGKHQPTLMALDDLPGVVSPRPEPCKSGPEPRWKRSKIRSRSSSAIPGPSSRTATQAQPCRLPAATVIVVPSGARRTALDSKFDTARSREAGSA